MQDDEYLDLRAEDVKEQIQVEKMFSENAAVCCSKECNKLIPKNLACNCRNCFADLSKQEQDLVLLGHIEAHRTINSLQAAYFKQNAS